MSKRHERVIVSASGRPAGTKVRFFAQAKLVIADDSEGVIAAGIRF